MDSEEKEEARTNFNWFSNEYAQALHALKAIETQSSTLLLLGGTDDLRTFIDQFLEMASKARALAIEKDEPNFAEWFQELIVKAEELRVAIAQR